MHITYRNNVYIDLNAAMQIVKDRILVHDGKSLPVLCDTRSIQYITKPARDYLAIEGSILISAVAFVTEPSVSELVAKFYLRSSKPTVPTQIFTYIHEALIFLSKF